MATKDKEQDELDTEQVPSEPEDQTELVQSSLSESEGRETEVRSEDETPAHLGVERYVHAAFFGAGILAAYLCGKILWTFWNSLADWPAAVRVLPLLVEYGEDQRETYTMAAGAILGALLVLNYYRKERVRIWANEVAGELARVTWPNRETVTNGTIVVLIASAVATVYIALLDRFWGFLTNLVYGA